MLSYKEFLQEIKYTDIYGGQFEEFRKKYKKEKNVGWLYVQFTNTSKDVLEKNPYGNPNHSDPVGIYGYPMRYVLDNPADIWYGASAKYIRVLKDKSKNPLRLSYISESDCYNLLLKVFNWSYSAVDYAIKKLKKFSRRDFTGSTKWGKILFSFIQLDFDNLNEKGEPTLRSGLEQTNIIKKLGYDAVEDEAKSLKQAVINDREPEQIIFLNRNAFEVIEVFNLRGADSGKKETHIGAKKSNIEIQRKLAAGITEIMDDKISEVVESYDYITAYTKKGRKLVIKEEDTSLNWRMKNLKIGQKKHKYSKLSSPEKFILTLFSEYGKDKIVFDENQDINGMLKDFKYEWEKYIITKEVNQEFKPLSKKYEEELEKIESDKATQKRLEEEEKKFRKDFDAIKDSFIKVCNMFNIKIDSEKINSYMFEYAVRYYFREGELDDEIYKVFTPKDSEKAKVFKNLYDLTGKMIDYTNEHLKDEKDRIFRHGSYYPSVYELFINLVEKEKE